MAKGGWIRATKREPCAVCGRDHFCTRSADGKLAKCTKIESDWPAKGDFGGWIHKLADPLPVREEGRDESDEKPTIDFGALAFDMYGGADKSRAELSARLGVSVLALERLGVGHSKSGRKWFWSFPERDVRGNVTGIVRRFEDGRKFSMKGSHSGLYFAMNWWRDPGPVLLPEGGSDAAALLTMGLCAIGRPSNLGGIEKLIGILHHVGNRPVIVLGENDRKPERVGTVKQCPANCEGCSWCWPGRFGAVQTAERVGRGLRKRIHWRMIQGAKDSREWLKTNGNDGRAFLESLDVPAKWVKMLGESWQKRMEKTQA